MVKKIVMMDQMNHQVVPSFPVNRVSSNVQMKNACIQLKYVTVKMIVEIVVMNKIARITIVLKISSSVLEMKQLTHFASQPTENVIRLKIVQEVKMK